MKKALIILIVLTVLTLSYVSAAISFDIKNNFSQEEILTAKLSGDFINPPLKENIFFYRGHVRVGIAPYIAKIGDTYYLYAALAGKTPGNYSIVIEDVEYTMASKTIKEDLTKNFTISESYADFIIDKGFVITKDDFYLEVENLKSSNLNILLNIRTISGEEGGISSYEEDKEYDITLKPGKERIDFKLDLIKQPSIKLIELTLGDFNYTIPVSIFVDEFSEQNQFFAFKIEPSEMDLTMPTSGDAKKRLVYIYNTGTGTLTDIKLSLSESLKPYVTISESTFGRILPDSNANLNMTIALGGEKSIAGELFVETAQKLAGSMRVIIIFEQDYQGEDIPELQTTDKCSNQGLIICLENEKCSDTSEIIYGADGVCCKPGKCIGAPSSSLGKIIAWIIILALITGAAWFFLKKYKNIKNPIDLLKIARGKNN